MHAYIHVYSFIHSWIYIYQKNSVMVEKLFDDTAKARDVTINVLKAYGAATKERLTAKQGGAAEFLEGGKLFNPSNAVAALMEIADATSDPIESFFGTHDQMATVQSKNTSFHVTGTLATWNHNNTGTWLQTLTALQRESLLRASVRQGRILKRQTDKDISHAAAATLKRMEKQAKATKAAEEKLIHDLLNLRSKELFRTTVQYESFVATVKDNFKKHLRELKQQIRLLRKVGKLTHAYTHTLIPYHVYTHMMCIHVGVWTPAQDVNDFHQYGEASSPDVRTKSIPHCTRKGGVRRSQNTCEERTTDSHARPTRFSGRHFDRRCNRAKKILH